MKQEELLSVYDQDYAEVYNDRFLFSPFSKPWSDFEHSILKRILKTDSSWLDIGCGTGYFLSQFPGIYRAGLDLSPGMLARAREVNPDAAFFSQGDFRIPNNEWNNRWSLVSCMWAAYIYVDSLEEVAQVITNMISWTSEKGSLFLPIIDFDELRPGVKVSFSENAYEYGGQVIMNSAIWTWVEHGSGRIHRNLISPHIEYFMQLLKPWFEKIEIIYYPRHPSSDRKCLLASGKRAIEADSYDAEIITHPFPESSFQNGMQENHHAEPYVNNSRIATEFFKRAFNGEFLSAMFRRIFGK